LPRWVWAIFVREPGSLSALRQSIQTAGGARRGQVSAAFQAVAAIVGILAALGLIGWLLTR
jgi:hypothetical protein